jgi:3-hydroxyisobutyrate dehydrogenase-like beta-hydroxyacid dehydrogenase
LFVFVVMVGLLWWRAILANRAGSGNAYNPRSADMPHRAAETAMERSSTRIEPGSAIGVIGLGLMGSAAATRLTAAGFRVFGYDVDPAAADRLGLPADQRARSVADIAAACDCCVVAVFNTAQVEDVLEGPAGLAAARDSGPERERPPLSVVCISTCDPDAIAALAARLPGDRIGFVEVPVSGTSQQFVKGDGLGLVAGSDADVARIEPVLQAMVPKRHRVGRPGDGGRAKLAINLMLGVNRAALAEGLVFAERMGLDPSAFLAVARDSAAYSQIMDVKGAKMIAADFTPHGKVNQSLKDFSLMLEQAKRIGQRLPLGETYAGLMQGCVDNGEAELDNGAVIREIRRRVQ